MKGEYILINNIISKAEELREALRSSEYPTPVMAKLALIEVDDALANLIGLVKNGEVTNAP